MSNLSHTVRNFNRFELKYLLTLEQAGRFKSALRAYLAPDEHGESDGRYALSSLYYDSPALRCYWEKLDGLRVRRKLRIRHYETGEVLIHLPDAPVSGREKAILRVATRRPVHETLCSMDAAPTSRNGDS